MPLAGRDAQPGYHLLDKVTNRQQKQHQPQHVEAVLRTRLRVGGDCAGIVIRLHHDEPGADNHQMQQ